MCYYNLLPNNTLYTGPAPVYSGGPPSYPCADLTFGLIPMVGIKKNRKKKIILYTREK